ncbi:hypothetical protein GP486_000796 [Trichoglossum hirsutum]|uniref:LNS2/PITP domain-containing protein n=1 Tax=Trichoglossum hirsutum TaxID=265104 RepID=A0A9P8LID0_9PEZI|nr:hypothetical protein GP486_000796 [Trichoglossum hirsutum]
MQYVRSISGSVSKTWNSINPATLSGAIDVIVVEQEDGSLACSPFHVRFGKFSLLRPYEKKVEFYVNGQKQDYAMKLGEGGEAFFVFETSEDIPEDLQTSPLVSPASSPKSVPAERLGSSDLQEPDFLDLSTETTAERRVKRELGGSTPLSRSPDDPSNRPASGDWSGAQLERSTSDVLPSPSGYRPGTPGDPAHIQIPTQSSNISALALTPTVEQPRSPPLIPTQSAVDRAISLSKKLSGSNIPAQVTDKGDIMLDMTGYKSSEEEALRAEIIARKLLSEELEGNYDIGALIGADEQGNLWIYSSEEAKEAAGRKSSLHGLGHGALTGDAVSDPGYQSDDSKSLTSNDISRHESGNTQHQSTECLVTPPDSPPFSADTEAAGDPNRNYAKTLRLTSDQLKALKLLPGPNSVSFSVNKATCQAFMYYWKYDVPIVISDIDGTITKSDALGHVLNMIGRDWTHLGVAKLYTDIVANGYHIMYLTSRSIGQADTTRSYLNGVVQDNYRLPKGPTILSPDRTIAALRREVYLRKPEVFKMACLRDIRSLFGHDNNPFYAGFGNRLTDALSYRSVNIPSTRIFTINSNAEVSLDLLTLNKYKSSYVSMREIVDHFFPSVGLLIRAGRENFTDFNYWRDAPLELDEFSASDTSEDGEDEDEGSMRSEDEGSEELLEEEREDEQGDEQEDEQEDEQGDEQEEEQEDEQADEEADEQADEQEDEHGDDMGDSFISGVSQENDLG